MSKKEFLNKWRTDYIFRNEMKNRGIQVIQDNVIFFDENGNLRNVAGNYVK